MTEHYDFLSYPDLASRALAGSVVWASDESFAERENLIMPHEPAFDPNEFGNKGKVYDGWETRRRRHDEVGENDAAIVRLGVPGHIKGIVVDTAWFKGNYPPQIAVHGLTCDEYLTGEELAALPDDRWFTLVAPMDAKGDHKHHLEIFPAGDAAARRVTHVKLEMIPDGGISRLRVHGQPAPDPRFITGTIDLAAVENGGRVTECTNMFYSHPNQIISIGRAHNMGGGWENARRRDDGNDSVTVQLAGEGRVRWIEFDTSYFVFNAPGDVKLTGITADGEEVELVGKTRVLPDTRHRFAVSDTAEGTTGPTPIVAVRADVYPDGGISRLRVWGELTDNGQLDIESRW
ncbi:allantoicase [Corynebacterium glyciniphilum]|uniref:allantoicase n=1 Tax=Corynebacterium glyciniphilum TaxID=1404244 RepID=UPI00264FE935|nr:allantoicase [Corynebacterium glyciniphilum]MDN5684995.1 allantoicase [Corynebacterium glyciniphilum]MDN6705019.1 allantoicase [Corynebacterium glyciniphilum]